MAGAYRPFVPVRVGWTMPLALPGASERVPEEMLFEI